MGRLSVYEVLFFPEWQAEACAGVCSEPGSEEMHTKSVAKRN